MNILTTKNRKVKFEIDAYIWLGAGIAFENTATDWKVMLALPVITLELTVFKKKGHE